jgi:GDP-D-mannose dehydratase
MNSNKKNLYTGVTGQDGAYLSEFFKKDISVHGLKEGLPYSIPIELTICTKILM